MAKDKDKVIQLAEDQTIEVGDRVRDAVSGFSGIVASITFFLNGCVRIDVMPEGLTKDGDIKDNKWFDFQQIEVIEKSVIPSPYPGDLARITFNADGTGQPGGDRPKTDSFMTQRKR